jgi:hypothetical protein
VKISDYTMEEISETLKQLTVIKHQYKKRIEPLEAQQADLIHAITHDKKRKGRSPIDRYCDSFKDVTMTITNIEDFVVFCDGHIKKLVDVLRKEYF